MGVLHTKRLFQHVGIQHNQCRRLLFLLVEEIQVLCSPDAVQRCTPPNIHMIRNINNTLLLQCSPSHVVVGKGCAIPGSVQILWVPTPNKRELHRHCGGLYQIGPTVHTKKKTIHLCRYLFVTVNIYSYLRGSPVTVLTSYMIGNRSTLEALDREAAMLCR